jgi:DNA-binding CsgD family transcriptional regulator
MELAEGDYLAHYGILRKSGRYPWGSGKNPHQRSKTFLDILEEHKKDGLSEAEIAALYDDKENGFPFTVADLRARKAIAIHKVKEEQIRQAQSLKDKGMGNSAIARQMGLNESTVRSLLEPGRLDKLDILQQTADMLKRQVDEKGMIDIGAHVERDLPIFSDIPNIGISKDKLNTALSMLKEEGYGVVTFRGPQVGTGELTTYKALVKLKPGQTLKQAQREAFLNRANLQVISEKSDDGGRTYQHVLFQKPATIDAKRVGVRYKEDGGADADGVIYVRPGVKDVSLGKNHYAQVRIAVNGTHFLKGMAIYKDDLPSGVDLVFNTNKSNTGNKLDAMKPLKRDQDGNVDWKNPFGAFPKAEGGQILGKNGKPESVMNILNEQGDWATWSRNLSRQVLSKQKPELAESQLALTYDRRRQEFNEIKNLTNPLIKRKLLESFADETDSAAVHLKAANLPRQATKVLLPVSSMKPTEVFAPGFRDGERVSLVRFPHAGTFEIPELTVNNRNREAKRLFSQGRKIQAPDAIGIHPKVAERLSGADFDGDAVVVIPNNRRQITNRDPLAGLRGFDPQAKYKVPTPDQDPKHGRITIDDRRKQNEMGRVTNLIADMTIKGAKDDEIARAVRHSMVVIDSEKHNLDFKASERDHGILELKRRYQGVNDKGQLKGASTLITRATAREDVPKRKDAPAGPGVTRVSNATIDNQTGRKVYVKTGEKDARGKDRTFRSKKLAETDDAFELLSDHGGTKIERIYAEHSNKLKALANEARLETTRTAPTPRSKSAAKVYSTEVQSLNAKLNDALKNAPLERRAQTVANQIVAQRRRANPDMDASEKKKIRGKALEEARVRTGAKKHRIDITDREWEAIQAGAISIDKLKNILTNTDVDKLKERATPRTKPVMTKTMTNRAKNMLAAGFTYAEISDALGIPESTLQSGIADGG